MGYTIKYVLKPTSEAPMSVNAAIALEGTHSSEDLKSWNLKSKPAPTAYHTPKLFQTFNFSMCRP